MQKLVLGILSILLLASLSAQEPEKNDLKVGVVLSGGGAKGLAHIGALKVIEEAGIRIDYIGGTSMGAIVGGMYAAGYSADELEQIVPKLGFDQYLEDAIPRKLLPFERKLSKDKYVISLPIKGKNIFIPGGINKGYNVLNKVSRYTEHVNSIQDFSQLPVPFVCIATDLVNGEQVTLWEGYLPVAMRASSAYPTLLTPVEMDDKILVDGGIVNNFPVDEVLEMGADILIGVDVSSNKLRSKDELNSLPAMIDQMISFQMVNDETLGKKDKTAVYIRPNIMDYSVTDFASYDSIIHKGAEATKLQLEALKKIAAQQIENKNKIKASYPRDEFFTVEAVRITGNENYSSAYIKEKLQLRLGKHINADDFYNGIDRLSATNHFRSIEHQISDGETGKIITIDVKENPIKSYLQLGVHYDPLFKSGVLLNFTTRTLLFKNDQLSTDFVIGGKFRYNLNYFIDNGVNASLGLQSTYQTFNFNTDFIYSGSTFSDIMNNLNLNYDEYNNRLYIQAVYKDNFAVGLGAQHKRIKATNENFTEASKSELFVNSDYISPYVFISYDGLNERYFSTRGFLFNGKAHWYLWADEDFFEFQAFVTGQVKVKYALPITKNFTAQVASEAAVSIGSNENPFLDYHLGGDNDTYQGQFVPFYGYEFGSFGNTDYLKTSLKLQYEVYPKHYLSAIGNIARVGKDVLFENGLFYDTKQGYALQYGIKTIAGPISLTYAFTPDIKNDYWSLKIGYWF